MHASSVYVVSSVRALFVVLVIAACTQTSASSLCHPSIALIGAAKCGTTALHDKLVTHPAIRRPVEKEPHFDFMHHTASEQEAYIDQLHGEVDDDDGRLTIDSSTHYLWNDTNLRALKMFCPSVRVVAVLCEPVKR